MKKFTLILMLFSIVIGCDESLPPRIVPENTLAITNIFVGQGTDTAGNIIVNIMITGTNLYEETFQDTVSVRGNVNIFWGKHPDIDINISLNYSNITSKNYRNGILTLDPGAKFNVKAVWYLNTDDGRNILNMLEYLPNPEAGILYAKPEVFTITVKLSLFRNTGLMVSDSYDFILEGWRKKDESY